LWVDQVGGHGDRISWLLRSQCPTKCLTFR
jgi:hypothetical protein